MAFRWMTAFLRFTFRGCELLFPYGPLAHAGGVQPFCGFSQGQGPVVV